MNKHHDGIVMHVLKLLLELVTQFGFDVIEEAIEKMYARKGMKSPSVKLSFVEKLASDRFNNIWVMRGEITQLKKQIAEFEAASGLDGDAEELSTMRAAYSSAMFQLGLARENIKYLKMVNNNRVDQIRKLYEEVDRLNEKKKKAVTIGGAGARASLDVDGDTTVAVLGAGTTTNITMHSGAKVVLQLDGGDLKVNINDVFHQALWWRDGKLHSSMR